MKISPRPLLIGTLLLTLAVPALAGEAGVRLPPRDPAAAPRADGSIRGQLVDASGEPVAGALVVLVDEGGRRRGATLSDGAGRFVLAVGAAGRHRLRAERVGYATDLSGPLEVAAGQTVAHRMVAGAQEVSLTGVAAGTRCEVRPGAGTPAGRVWEEARKALAAAAVAQEQELFTFALRRWRRELEPASLQVTSEVGTAEIGTGWRPFRTAPAAELRDRGWVRDERGGRVFFAPDAAALLADEFLDTHCFRVVPDPHDGARVGLAFEPAGGRTLPDVRGTLWLDRGSAELRELEFGYTGLAVGDDAGRPGGRVEFERETDGAWVMQRWSLRTPGGAERGRSRAQRTAILVEEGGEVVEVSPRGAGPVRLAAPGAVEGVVFDSSRAAPLAGARVFVAGTGQAAVADAAGRFRLEGVAPGVYGLSFSHPRLDTLEYEPTLRTLRVAEGVTARAALAVPPLARIRTAACGDSLGAGAALFGTVVNLATDIPLAQSRVTASWDDPAAPGGRRSAETVADLLGRYHFCRLPAGVPVELGGSFLERAFPVRTLTLAAGSRREQGIETRSYEERARVGTWTVSASAQPVRLGGRILRAGGEPIPGVAQLRLTRERLASHVAVRGAPALDVNSMAEGEFQFPPVTPGLYVLTIVHPELGTHTRRVAIGGGEDMKVEVRLTEPATETHEP